MATGRTGKYHPESEIISSAEKRAQEILSQAENTKLETLDSVESLTATLVSRVVVLYWAPFAACTEIVFWTARKRVCRGVALGDVV